MSSVYYIKNTRNYSYLNKKGGWNRSRDTYGLLFFNTKEEAEAAIPDGVDCFIEKAKKKEKKILENVDYVLFFKNKILNKENEFKNLDEEDDSVYRFDSEEAAVTKAEELDLDMERVEVRSVPKSTLNLFVKKTIKSNQDFFNNIFKK